MLALPLLARYNAWANLRVFDLVARLPEHDYLADMGLFFRSVHATLNHVLVMDRLWTARILNRDMDTTRLDVVRYANLVALRTARIAEDQALMDLVASFDEADLARPIVYRTLAGDEHVGRLADLLWNLFNHQTHHRGQIHAVLTRLRLAPPPLDVIYFLVEQGLAGPPDTTDVP